MIRKCSAADISTILLIINDAARAYKGVIPAACWHEPYMAEDSLKKDIASGVEFYGFEGLGGGLEGVMGLQYFPEVTLVRHAYVLKNAQGNGVGGKLLAYLLDKTTNPVLIGTWRDTPWSVKFYQKHGFTLLPDSEASALLNKYWIASAEHFAHSVVLADSKFISRA